MKINHISWALRQLVQKSRAANGVDLKGLLRQTNAFTAKAFSFMAVFMLLVSSFLTVPATPVRAHHDPFGGVEQKKVDICHIEGNGSLNLSPNVNVNAITPTGHHQHVGDIIPPFHHKNGVYNGSPNWNNDGIQAIWENGCKPVQRPGSLKVIKETIDGNGLFNFNYKFSDDAQNLGNFQINTDNGMGMHVIDDLAVGEYSVTEYDLPDGWLETSNNCVEVEVVSGQQATCTIVNTYYEDEPETGTLTLEKYVEGSDEPASSWTLTATGPQTIFGPSGSDSVTDVQVLAGTYTLSEDGPAGYTASDWYCDFGNEIGITLENNQVSISDGDNVECYITNTFEKKGSEIAIEKVWQDAQGEPIRPPQFLVDFEIVATSSEDEMTCKYEDGELVCDSDGTLLVPSEETYSVVENGLPSIWTAVEGVGDQLECNTRTKDGADCTQVVINKLNYAPPCDTNLVRNHSFERPAINKNWDIRPSGTPGLEWQVEWVYPDGAPQPANIELQKNVKKGWDAQHGRQYTELDSDWGGPGVPTEGPEKGSARISQHLLTKAGSLYEVTYWTSPRPGLGKSENTNQLLIDGVIVKTKKENGNGNEGTKWTKRKYSFIASGPVTVIAFQDGGTPNTLGTFLDNVKVKEDCTPPCRDEGPGWADQVVDEETLQGTLKNGNPITDPNRTNPEAVLGEADWTTGPGKFYSLGKDGYVTIEFERYAIDAEGDRDISIHEATNGRTTYPLETALIEVSQNGTDWEPVGTAGSKDNGDGVSYFDLAVTSFSWVKFVRVTDTTDFSQPEFNGNADGFDLDAVDSGMEVCKPPKQKECRFEDPQDNPLDKVVASVTDFITFNEEDTEEEPQEHQSCQLSGYKYNDVDGDGNLSEGDFGMAEVQIYLDLNNDGEYQDGEPTTFTDENGFYHFDYLNAGIYHVLEVVPPGYSQTYPNEAKGFKHTVELIWKSIFGLNFFNHQDGGGGSDGNTISGKVYADTNQNEVMDEGEVGLEGWTLNLFTHSGSETQTLVEPLPFDTEVSDENGDYEFTGVPDGCYILSEELQSNWAQTEPPTENHQYEIALGSVECDFDNEILTQSKVDRLLSLVIKTASAQTAPVAYNFGNFSTASSGGGGGSGGSGTRTGTVLGDSTGLPYQAPEQGQVLGATDELPRTGLPVGWMLWVFAGLAIVYLPKFATVKN